MNITSPTEAQMKQVFSMDDNGPLNFINLIKFNPDGGAESFRQYAQKFSKLMELQGVKTLFQANCLMSLMGKEEWDVILIVTYPTLSTWKNMIQSEEYKNIAHHRSDAVIDARLIITE